MPERNQVGTRRMKGGGSALDRYQLSVVALVLPSVGVLLLAGLLVTYLHTFALSTGLDSTSDVYRAHWYSLLAGEIVVVVPAVMFAVRRLARSTCQICAAAKARSEPASPHHELDHFWTLFGLILGGAISANCVPGLVGMHDTAWHTVILRDTSLSPTHIPIFFGMAPVTVGLVMAAFIYGRTRLPELWGPSKGIPAAYVVAGGAWVLTMLFFGLNEFAHTQWIPEERITNPWHLAFMIPFWSQLAILSPVLYAVPRIHQLAWEILSDKPPVLAREAEFSS